MKQIYKNEDYVVYKITLLGYSCQIYKSKSGVLMKVPYGKTKEDKKMFDSLVYYNRGVYYHKNNIKELKKQVRTWIKNYKLNKNYDN